ncbi:class I mannose-6-phosphate isomerase [Saccharopolyspora flava]|uniref:Mannose-6-phosphate isomerase n=1 Tax=Saccharopolyspora flava TaxID=95161 RepID=A0A1I6PDN1_9PSEU|nr:class I mannose-6-phosphate isomerase [Saccharopolyspora flava]SFS38195.1 mannose-6-phosphate isomerase [Saccharopolyspora flava]
MSSVHSALPAQAAALPANQPRQFYRGGASIAALRGGDHDREFGPEDWVASTTARFGHDESGLSRLPDGRLLRDAVSADPQAWLGAEHTSAFGDSTALLVKLLDAGQRLPVHCHPDNGFAQRHLGSRFGKTEAWIVVGTSGPNPVVHLGFRDDVSPETVAEWVRTQDSSAMLGSLNEIPVKPGDTVHVPAGTPHAIGAGVFIVELQQPTDFSITLEWRGFLADAESAFLGLDTTTALETVNRTRFDDALLSSLIKRTGGADEGRVPLLADDAAPFFRADRLHGPAELDPSFGVLIVLDGRGELHCAEGSPLQLSRGTTVVVPHAAGRTRLDGDLTTVLCRPPSAGSHA